MTTYIIMEAAELAADMDMVTVMDMDTAAETLLLTMEPAAAAAVIATAIMATAALAQNALARAATALALATAKVLAASTAAVPAARNAATVLDLLGKWTRTLKTLDKAIS
jgi:hypothetical protein